MSGILFSTAPGTLVAHRSTEAPTAALIKVEGLGAAQSVILTGLTVTAETAYQVASTIGGPQYLFPFGDKLQEIQVNLLVFPMSCQDAGSSQQSPLTAIWAFYYNKRITPDKIQTVKITFGGQTITGLITALRCSASLDQGVPMVECTLSLMGWAEDTASAASQASNQASNQASSDSALGTGGASATATQGSGLSQPGGFFTSLADAGVSTGTSQGGTAEIRNFLGQVASVTQAPINPRRPAAR